MWRARHARYSLVIGRGRILAHLRRGVGIVNMETSATSSGYAVIEKSTDAQ